MAVLVPPFFAPSPLGVRAPLSTTAFVPTSIANLSLWLRGDLGITLDGSSNVSGWTNQAGANHSATQATAGLRPPMGTINGKAAVSFNGTSQYLIDATAGTPFTTLSGRTTAFVVWEHTTGNGIQVGFHMFQAAAQEAYFYTGITANQGGYLHRAANAVGTNLTGKHILSGRNFAAALSVFDKTTSHASVAAAGATNAFTTYTIGSYVTPANYFGGKVGEILVYDRELNSTELGQVITYLSAFWGI